MVPTLPASVGRQGGGGVIRTGTPAPRNSEAMERSARILRQLDALEADLHQGSAEMATYAELVDRHARTEQIACKVTNEHVGDIERLAAVQEARMQRKSVDRLKRKALALARRHPARRTMASN
jgi:uncharacterized protein YhaN